MGLIQPFAIKTVLDDTDLELVAGPGESFLIKDILTHYEKTSYVTMRTDKSTVGYIRTGGDMGGHIFRLAAWNQHSHRLQTRGSSTVSTPAYRPILDNQDVESKLHLVSDSAEVGTGEFSINEAVQMIKGMRQETLLQYLTKKGIWKGFPVAEGETFKMTGVKQAKAIQVVIYEIHEAGDMTPDMENGSKSPVYTFLNYGDCGAAININGDSLYNTSRSPAEFPSFPFGADVPAKYQVELLGICASPFAPKGNRNDHYNYTQFMKLIKDREVLFDEDRQGILFHNRQYDLDGRSGSIAQGFSLIGNKSEFDLQDPFMFDPPLLFAPGDELGVYVTTIMKGTAPDITQANHEICLIERVTRL